MSFCTNCGKELPENVKFCPECGTEVLQFVKVEEAPEEIIEESVIDETTILVSENQEEESFENTEEFKAETEEEPKTEFEEEPKEDASNFRQYSSDGNRPGNSNATAALVLGILSIAFCFGGVSAFISVVLGIIGLVCASKAKKDGYIDGKTKAGFVLSLLGVIFAAIVIVLVFAAAAFFVAVF